MTLAVAARYDGGVLLATDSALGDSQESDSRMFVPAMKGWDMTHLSVLFAGQLWAADKVRREVPDATTTSEGFACHVMDIAAEYKDKEESQHPDFPAEFIVVDRRELGISLVSGQGGIFTGYDWLAIGSGSIEGNVGLDLELGKARVRTYEATKYRVARVLFSVGRWNASVGGVAHFDCVPEK